jgi:hypothetical protein
MISSEFRKVEIVYISVGPLVLYYISFQSKFYFYIYSSSELQILTNGIEVKLQRNALTVIEAPNGNETDDGLMCDNYPWNLATDMGIVQYI